MLDQNWHSSIQAVDENAETSRKQTVEREMAIREKLTDMEHKIDMSMIRD